MKRGFIFTGQPTAGVSQILLQTFFPQFVHFPDDDTNAGSYQCLHKTSHPQLSKVFFLLFISFKTCYCQSEGWKRTVTPNCSSLRGRRRSLHFHLSISVGCVTKYKQSNQWKSVLVFPPWGLEGKYLVFSCKWISGEEITISSLLWSLNEHFNPEVVLMWRSICTPEIQWPSDTSVGIVVVSKQLSMFAVLLSLKDWY